MDVNDLRITVTVVSLVLFLALMARTWSRSRKAEYDAAAMLPFSGESGPAADRLPGDGA
jgi:cbb3-type cytochrome oxidase subunit 3